MKEILDNFKVVVEMPVRWGDMDARGHVNNTIYYRYFESSRIALFQFLNIYEDPTEVQIGPILSFQSCYYKAPLTYPDTVYIGAKIVSIEGSKIIIKHVLVSEKYGFSLKDNVKMLINEEASTQNIKKIFGTWLKQKVKEDDSVIIYFAGHGASEAKRTYWVTYDSDIENLYETAIGNDSISKMLNSIESKTLIVFLDSCYSAATINRGWHTRSLIEKNPFEEFKGEGRVVITSSNGKQLSLEIQEYGHGVFTYFLIQGLIGKADQDIDGYVTLDEIWDYVKSNVQNTAKKFGIHQTPIIDGRHSSGILLSKYPKK